MGQRGAETWEQRAAPPPANRSGKAPTPARRTAAIYVSATPSGEWPDGAAFAGIRFIDRFEAECGLIHSRQVWNDLAESAGWR